MSALLLAVLLGGSIATDSFPHAAHRRLFASCATCHAGIVSGDSSTARPPAPACAACHDGTLAPRVDWVPRIARATSLRFDHRAHARRPGNRDTVLTCASCHATSEGAPFMQVSSARPERCLGCHEPSAPSHLAAANCATCHRPLAAATRLAVTDIEQLPRPPSHDSGWVFRHGPQASQSTCAFCHTRESCAACHVNATRVRAIAALPTDARAAAVVLARDPVTYPRPSSHRSADFARSHGAMASAAGATCASCHARESCLGCHRTEERLAPITSLVRRTAGGAPGVELSAARPPDHGPGFALNHRAAAAGGDRSCSSCHAPSYCATCHDATASPAFHPRNFVSRHGAESFGATTECASCHQTQAFCLACHRETGRASQTGATSGKYHDAQPRWTFAHGAVARRSIESCASCHRQNDCLQCHSSRGGWGVNPHGAGFDAGLGQKNPAMCARCHVGGPPSR